MEREEILNILAHRIYINRVEFEYSGSKDEDMEIAKRMLRKYEEQNLDKDIIGVLEDE